VIFSAEIRLFDGNFIGGFQFPNDALAGPLAISTAVLSLDPNAYVLDGLPHSEVR
jgi:hypothetical protein